MKCPAGAPREWCSIHDVRSPFSFSDSAIRYFGPWKSAKDELSPAIWRTSLFFQDVALAYRQAFGDQPVELAPLPSTAREVREMLGADFVRQFADRVEERLDVDVVRIPGLTTAYGLEVLGRRVIVLDASGNWFRQNFSLAHELGHMVSRTPSRDASDSLGTADEAPANNFAAELLLPAAVLREMIWTDLSVEELAHRVWDWGVSITALRNRLDSLGIAYSAVVEEWCAHGRTTQGLGNPGLAWRDVGSLWTTRITQLGLGMLATWMMAMCRSAVRPRHPSTVHRWSRLRSVLSSRQCPASAQSRW